MRGWELACPRCATALFDQAAAPQDTKDSTSEGSARCPGCGAEYVRRAGIWQFLRPEDQERIDRFLADYTHIRRAEGRGSIDPGYYRALPEVAATDPLAWQWGIRQRSWCHAWKLLFAASAAPQRIIDLGAGVGWLSNRLTLEGHDVLAVDVSLDDLDGLGAARHFECSFARVQAHFDHLPLLDAQADVVLFNASLHYSADYVVTLGEALRVLRPEGSIVVLDSPLYRRDSSGRQMVEERHADFAQRFGRRSDSVPSRAYLTSAVLAELAECYGLQWERSRPFYGLRWAARPWVARLRREREPSRFEVIVGRR